MSAAPAFIEIDDLFDLDSGATAAAAQTRQALVSTHEQMGVMLDIMPIGLLVHSSQGILYANRAASRLMCVGQDALVGSHVLDFLPDAYSFGLNRHLNEAFSLSQPVEFETTLRTSEGIDRQVKFIVASLPWAGTPVIQVLMQDVTEQKEVEQTLRRLTITDELTGAFNRRHIMSEAALHIHEDGSSRSGLSVIMLDIDHFKSINDRYGHKAGDEALKLVADAANRVLNAHRLGEGACFARFGGEEFLVLLAGEKSAVASEIAEHLRRAIAEVRVDHPEGGFGLTASFGVATYRQADRSVDALLVRADTALYRSKSNGRDRVTVADEASAR